MTILFISIFCLLLVLVLAICLRPHGRDSWGHMIDAGWLDSNERFKLVTRWGAQL